MIYGVQTIAPGGYAALPLPVRVVLSKGVASASARRAVYFYFSVPQIIDRVYSVVIEGLPVESPTCPDGADAIPNALAAPRSGVPRIAFSFQCNAAKGNLMYNF